MMSTTIIASDMTYDQDYPYRMESFYRCWWDTLASKFSTQKVEAPFLIYQRKLFKGRLSVRELRMPGWNNPTSAQDLLESDIPILERLMQHEKWDYFKMTWTESRRGKQAFSCLQQKGYQYFQYELEPECIVDLSQGWENYLASRSQKERISIRRKFKKAEPLNPQWQFFRADNEIDAFFEMFFPHHIRYWSSKTGKSYLADTQEQQFIRAWAKALSQSGHLLMLGLQLDGQLAHLSLNIVANQILFTPLAINTGNYLKYAPGLLGVYLLFQQAEQFKFKTARLCAGPEEYKRKAATHQEKRYCLILPHPRSLKGKLYLQWLNKTRGYSRIR